MWKYIKSLFSFTSTPPLGVWIPYYDWCEHPQWREEYAIIAYDKARNYIKVGISKPLVTLD